MAIREWRPNTEYKQGDCVLIPDGSGGYMGDASGANTWLLCCVGSGSTVDASPYGRSGATKTQTEWATLFEGSGTDGNVSEATVMPATLSAGAGPDGNIRWARGTAYFLDTSAAANGNGSYASPYNTSDSITAAQITSSDGTNSTRHLYIKRGTTVRTDSGGGDWLGRGSLRRHYATITSYGSGELPRIDAAATSGTGNAGLLVYKTGANAARYCLIEEMEVLNADGDGISIYLGTAESALAQNDIIVRNNHVHHCGASGIQAITGGAVDRSTTSTGVYITGNTVHDTDIYGIAVREWWDGGRIEGNVIYNTGLDAINGAYGISTIGNFVTHTGTGWTQVSPSPNVWERTFSRSNNVVEGRYRRASDQSEVILALGTYGALSADYQIANSGATVQVRLAAGETPTNMAIWVCYNRVKNVTIVDNDVSRTNDFRAASSRFDGDGIGIDQFSQGIKVLRNRVSDNGGCGIITNQPTDLDIIGNVFVSNGRQKAAADQTNAGILVNHPRGTVRVLHNNVIGQVDDGIRVYNTNGDAPQVTNNLVMNCGGAALYGTIGTADGGINESYNWLSGNAANSANITLDGTNVTTSATAYVSGDGSPKSAGYTSASRNPVATAGTYIQGVTLQNGRPRPGDVPIGAFRGVVERDAA